MTVNPNWTDVAYAITHSATSKTIEIGPGTLIVDHKSLPNIAHHDQKFVGYGVTVRAVQYPGYVDVEMLELSVMAILGLPGDGGYYALDKTQQATVQSYIKTHTVDVSAMTLAVQKYIADNLKPIIDTTTFEAKPPKSAQVTVNGKPYLFSLKWRASVSKGLFTIQKDFWGSRFYGFRFQNARMDGSSNNAAGIRAQNTDALAADCSFESCEMGLLAGIQGIAGPTGIWYPEVPNSPLVSLYGFVMDVNCTYDWCGSPLSGDAHPVYGGETLFDISVGAKSIRSNGGHFRKMDGGEQWMLDGILQDDGSDDGVEQCWDATSGACGLVNNVMLKISAGGGNFGPTVLVRNNRQPIPPKEENTAIIVGNDLTWAPRQNPKHGCPGVVQVLEAPTFKVEKSTNTSWPGVPRPIRTSIRNNILRCVAGAPAGQHGGISAPVGYENVNNVVLGLTDVGPNVKVPLTLDPWTRANLIKNWAALVSAVDPAAAARVAWKESLPLYPTGISFPL